MADPNPPISPTPSATKARRWPAWGEWVCVGLLFTGVGLLYQYLLAPLRGLFDPEPYADSVRLAAIIIGPWLLCLLCIANNRLAPPPPPPTTRNPKQIVDARGEVRTVAHADSAGLFARDLPHGLRAKAGNIGLRNMQTHYTLPPLRRLAGAIAMSAGLTFYLAILDYRLIWIGFLPLALAIVSTGRNRLAECLADFYLQHDLCPACLYNLQGLTTEPDGATICPECHAAWKTYCSLPETTCPSTHATPHSGQAPSDGSPARE